VIRRTRNAIQIEMICGHSIQKPGMAIQDSPHPIQDPKQTIP
jgi:hypothetical protein